VTDEGGDPACWAGQLTTGPRALSAAETGELLNADLVAHLGSVDRDGFPRITPIWFLWDGDAFVMSCLPHRPHVRRLTVNPNATLCIDDEAAEGDDGQRPNRQVRAVGRAEVSSDVDGVWTRRISEKYLHGPGAARQTEARGRVPRVVIRLAPDDLVAIASV
jgi:nitroimidazol reductase NimA-like FMN-containing flavoprotein (pyridoxamine 5'-phosphate oxidase superfamily)